MSSKSKKVTPIEKKNTPPARKTVKLSIEDRAIVQNTMDKLQSLHANLGMETYMYEQKKKQIESNIEEAGKTQIAILESIKNRLELPDKVSFNPETLEFII